MATIANNYLKQYAFEYNNFSYIDKNSIIFLKNYPAVVLYKSTDIN